MKHSKQPKQVKIADVTGRADNYQVSRALPDLRVGGDSQSVARAMPLPSKAIPAIPTKNRRWWPGWKKALKRTVLVLLTIFLLGGIWLGYKALRNTDKLGTNLFSFFNNSKLKGEDRGHINILLAGVSTDDPGHQGADLTDSIMLISINPNNKTAFIMSIPRDLYVNIPKSGYAKINAANVYGNQQNFTADGYPHGGVGLLEETVSQDFNVPIDYYAVINYTAFRDAVNAVGGVTVTINSPYRSGVYDPYAGLKLPNGTQQLNGQQALALARARGDGPGAYGVTSDFDRTGYQRTMLVGLKDKATSLGVLTNPVKLGNLFDAIGNNTKTDLSLGNIRRLNSLTKGISDGDIKSVSLNSYNKVNYLRNYTTYDGQSALIPAAGIDNYTQIQGLVTQLMATTPAAAATTSK